MPQLKLARAERFGHGMQAAAVYVDQSLEEVGRGGVATAVQHHGKEVQACWQGLRGYGLGLRLRKPQAAASAMLSLGMLAAQAAGSAALQSSAALHTSHLHGLHHSSPLRQV